MPAPNCPALQVPPRLQLVSRIAPLLAVAFLAGRCAAEPPTLLSTAPQALAPGQTSAVVVRGQHLAGATQLWTTFSDPVPLAPDVAGNGQSDSDCTFQLAAPTDAPLGIHALRVISPNGASALSPFLVDDLPTVAEAPDHQTLATAQEVPTACGIDGRVDNLSRDFFKFTVTAGQLVSFEVFARRLGSPLDASLYLYDSDGRILTYCDDVEGLSADPQFAFSFKVAGTYVLEIRDIRYQGGDQHVYRLRIGDFPCVNSAAPLAVKRGTESRVDFAGLSIGDASPAFINVPADWPHPWFPVSTRRAGGSSSGFTMVTVADDSEVLEREPNNTQAQAQRVELGAGLNGRFEQPGDIDRFMFSAKKGQRYLFTGVTREQGSPTDLLLRMLDAGGNQLAAADDNGTAEGVLDVPFPADGEYTLEVTDLNHRGGPQFAYRISEESWQPGFSLSAAADTLNVPAGGVAPLTISTVRRDYGGAIELTVEGLPPGYSIPSTFLGPGVNQTIVTISAAPDVGAASLSGVSVIGRATIGATDFEARASLNDSLRTRWNSPAFVSPRLTGALAVAAAPAPKLTLRIDPPTVVFGRNLTATAKVIATRSEGLDEAIQLAINPPQDGLPPNVALDIKPIEKGQQEAVITFSANENAQLGPFTVVVNGTHQKDNVATVVTAPGIALRVDPPFTASAAPASELVLSRGAELKLKVSVQRNPAYAGEVKVAFEKLPAGVTAPETIVPADQSEVEVALAAAADAPQVTASDVVLKLSSPADGKISATVPVPAFNVQ